MLPVLRVCIRARAMRTHSAYPKCYRHKIRFKEDHIWEYKISFCTLYFIASNATTLLCRLNINKFVYSRIDEPEKRRRIDLWQHANDDDYVNAIDSSVTNLIHINYQWRILKLRSLAWIQVFRCCCRCVWITTATFKLRIICALISTQFYIESTCYLTERDTRAHTSNHIDMGDARLRVYA